MICASKEAVKRWIHWGLKQNMLGDSCGCPGLHLFSLAFSMKPNIPEFARWN